MELLTDRLRLVPIGPDHADDLWQLYQDPIVAHWYAETWTREEARHRAAAMGEAWATDGVSKWMAYDRETGDLVGRGGLSRLTADNPVTDRIAAVLPENAWRDQRLELGWALRSGATGRGYATEIGRAGLDHAFGPLGASTVIAFTEVHNRASRAVMERLAMTYVGEIAAPGLVEGSQGVHDNAPFAVYKTNADHSSQVTLPAAVGARPRTSSVTCDE